MLNALAKLLLGLACFIGLTSCAGGPITPQTPLNEVEITQGQIEGQGGTQLFLNQWSARGKPKAVIIAVHGYGDHGSLTFGRAAKFWASQGITTYAYDQRGFGHNKSFRKWAGPKVMAADLRSITGAIRLRHPDIPLTIVGHSMGGGVVLAAAESDLHADRIVLAGPAIVGSSEVNPFIRLGGWLLGLLTAEKRFTGDGLVKIQATDNIDALREARADPYIIDNPSGRELFGLIRLMDRAARAARKVDIPTLTLVGQNEQIFDPRAVARIHNTIPGRAGLITYPNGWHWLFRDKQAAVVWRDVATFALSGQTR